MKPYNNRYAIERAKKDKTMLKDKSKLDTGNMESKVQLTKIGGVYDTVTTKSNKKLVLLFIFLISGN